MNAVLDQTVGSVRRISADLRPLMLDDLGLVDAATWLVEDFAQRAGIECALDIAPDADVRGPSIAAQPPRCTGRCRSRSPTSRATRARGRRGSPCASRATPPASKSRTTGAASMAEDIAKPRSLGLKGMRERALYLGGSFEVSRAPRGGTQLRLRVPLRPADGAQRMIRVLIADDHKLVRDGLKGILAAAQRHRGRRRSRERRRSARPGARPGIRRRAARPVDAGPRRHRPHQAAARWNARKLRILVLSMHGEQQYAARALKAGAAGYLTKDAAAEQLVSALRKVAAGGVAISEATAASLLASARGGDGPPHSRLSDREFEVFRLLAGGRTPTEIAEQLHLSVKTVSTHKAHLQRKLGLTSTAELVRYALEHDLL